MFPIRFAHFIRPTPLLVASILLFGSQGLRAQDDWIAVSESERQTYHGLAGSYELRTNRSGEQIATITGRVYDKVDKRITLEKIYVRVEHCRRRQGKLVALTMDGEFKYDVDFIFGAGSVGSTKAEFVCRVFALDDKKGI